MAAKKAVRKTQKKTAAKPSRKRAAARASTRRPSAGKNVARKAAKKSARKAIRTKKSATKATRKKATKKKVPRQKTAKKKAAKKGARAAGKSKKRSTKKTVRKKTVTRKAAKKKVVKKKVARKPTSAKKTRAKKTPTAKRAADKRRPSKKRITTKRSPVRARSSGARKRNLLAGPVRGFVPYHPARGERYMSGRQLAHFRKLLDAWKMELMEEVDRTMLHMKDDAANFPDPSDRATQESEFGLELRTRDRERKLLKKIASALQRVEGQTYGYCEETGEEIGLRRLEARPVATLCVEAQERRELAERQYRDREDSYR